MSAAILFVVVGLAIFFGYLVGQGRAYAECETRDTEALRLAAAARAEEQRQFRAAVLSEALGVIGDSCRRPIVVDAPPRYPLIDVTGDEAVIETGGK